MTVLMALSSIAVEKMKAIENTMERCIQLLDYLATNETAKIRFHALEMILNIHSDTPLRDRSPQQSMWTFFMGWMPKDNKPIQLNGAFHMNSTIMRIVVASTTEAELGALFHNCQTGIIF